MVTIITGATQKPMASEQLKPTFKIILILMDTFILDIRLLVQLMVPIPSMLYGFHQIKALLLLIL